MANNKKTTKVFRNNNHMGDCLLQLGLLKMLHDQCPDISIGYEVNTMQQFQIILTARWLANKSFSINKSDSSAIDFVGDESCRGKMRLIDMWARSIPYKLAGERKPYIHLTSQDCAWAELLSLKTQTFVAPFKATCQSYAEVKEGQEWMKKNLANQGYYLLGLFDDPHWPGFKPVFGLPIRIVGALLQKAKALYCLNNGIANLAWAVGQKNIYEWLGPVTEWGKVPYSIRLEE